MEKNKQKEALEKAEQGLWQAIYELTWAGILWGEYGAVKLSEIRFEILIELGRAQDAVRDLLSTYYTAWTNALASPKNRQAKRWIQNHIAEIKKMAEGLREFSIENSRVGDLMIRSRVLFRLGDYQGAVDAGYGIIHMQQITRVEALLVRVEMGEAMAHLEGEQAEAEEVLHSAVSGLSIDFDIKTHVRVFKTAAAGFAHLAKVAEENKEIARQKCFKNYAGNCLARAHELAEKHGLGDQIVKIEALGREIKKLKDFF